MLLSLEDAVKMASENLIRDGNLLPVAFVEVGGEITIVGVEISEEHGARELLHSVGRMFPNAEALSWISDAWVSKQEDLTAPIMRPSQDPKRTEALVGVASTGEGAVESSIQWGYTRTAAGIVMDVSPHIMPNVESFVTDAFWRGVREGKELDGDTDV